MQGLGRQPIGGNSGWLKPQKLKAKKVQGVGKANDRGEFAADKTPETQSKESAGGWEGNQPGGIWGG